MAESKNCNYFLSTVLRREPVILLLYGITHFFKPVHTGLVLYFIAVITVFNWQMACFLSVHMYRKLERLFWILLCGIKKCNSCSNDNIAILTLVFVHPAGTS